VPIFISAQGSTATCVDVEVVANRFCTILRFSWSGICIPDLPHGMHGRSPFRHRLSPLNPSTWKLDVTELVKQKTSTEQIYVFSVCLMNYTVTTSEQ